MHNYELMVIMDPSIDERTVAPTLDKFLTVITAAGGTLDKIDIWGRTSHDISDPEALRRALRSG